MAAVIHAFNWKRIPELLYEATEYIRLVLPALHEEWAQLLIQVQDEKSIDIKVCLNNNEKCIRDGFGDQKAIEELISAGIEIHETKDNRISFISNGREHFLFFPTSRIFEGLEDEIGVTNAVAIDDYSALQIIYSFFPGDKPDLPSEVSERLTESFEQSQEDRLRSIQLMEIDRLPGYSIPLNKEEFDRVKKALEANPPQPPDLRRQIDVYMMKVQFVELNFKNGNISGRRVRLPAKVMPFLSADLKRILESSLKLFQDHKENEKYLEGYKAIQQQVKELRETYLKNIRCRNDKSVLEKIRREDFVKQISKINEGLKNVEKNLVNEIDDEIFKTQEELIKQLVDYFTKDPPTEFTWFEGESLKRNIEVYASNLVHQMKFPRASDMVQGMKLEYKFYDLTWEDLSDEQLLKEFEMKGILEGDIDQIRSLKIAYEVKR